MRTSLLRTCFGLCLLLGWHPHLAQDRNPPTNAVYPDGVFSSFEADTTRIPTSGRVIDVTRPPFNATGDGVTDDTEAINAAYTFVAEQLEELSWRSGNQASYIIYFPTGTYLVSNTIIHNLGQIFYPGLGREDTEGVTWVRFVGQNRDNTIIRLKDNSPGFEAGTDKEVISFQKENVGNREGNNIPAASQLSNLTINVGSGNPGAIGASYISANTGQISNIKIVSEDGQGAVGLSLPFFSVQGYYRDITIEGFDYGIRALRGEVNPTFEYVTLRNQNVAGILANDASVNIRRAESTNSVPFMIIQQDEAQVIVLESQLLGGDGSTPAIDLQDTASQLFVRNTQVSGYGSSIRQAGEDVVTGDVDEYISDQVYTLFEGVTPKSLDLPVADSPILDWVQDTAQWANVDTYPGANDTERIQNAMNSGKPAVYFPRAFYQIESPITIPATVRHVDFLYSRASNGGEFIIDESSSETLFLEHTNINRSILTQTAPRPTVIRNASFDSYRYLSDQPSELFLEGSGSFGDTDEFCPPPLKIWGRSINNEIKSTSNFKVVGGTLWAMGYKTEGETTAFEVRNGGSVEVLGGLRNETVKSPEEPFLLNVESNASFIGYNFLSGGGNPIITEVQGGLELQLFRSELPAKSGNSVYVPLYVGTTDATVPACLSPIGLVSTTGLTVATLTWNGRNDLVSNYEVRYRELNTPVWEVITGIADTTVDVPELIEGGNYEWEVRADCGDGEFSSWSAPAQFTMDLGIQRVNDSLAIDGVLDEAAWSLTTTANKEASGTVNNDVTFGLLWDNTNLYVGVRVLDEALFNDSERPFQDDAVEVYIDVNNNGGPYDSFDNQFILGYDDSTLFISNSFDGTRYQTIEIDGGYTAELAIPWSGLGIVPGSNVSIGLDIGVNDDDNGGDDREGQQVWAGSSGNFRDASGFGDVILQDTIETATTLRLHYTWDGVTADEVTGLESSFSNIASFSEDAAIGSNSVEIAGDSLVADNAAVAIPGGSLLNSAFTTRSYSLWIKARDTEAPQILFEEGGDAGGAGFQLEDDSLRVLFRYGGGADFTTLKVPFVDSDEAVEWTHLAVTYEAGIIGVYVNGTLAGSVVSSASAIPSHANPPSLGGVRNNQSPTDDDGFYFNGFLDEFKVFDGVLTLQEITELADRPIPAPPATLRLYYPWDGTTADEIVGLESSLNAGVASFSPETRFGSNSIEVKGSDSLLVNSGAIAIDNGSFLNESFSYRSYSLWVRARNTTPEQLLFEEGGAQGGVGFLLGNDNLLVQFRYGGGSNFTALSVPFADSDEAVEWTHLAVTYETGRITVYVNGEAIDSVTSPVGAIPAHANPPSLGGVRGNQSPVNGDESYLDGFLDELRVFDGVLTAEEVAELAILPEDTTDTFTLGDCTFTTDDFFGAAEIVAVNEITYADFSTNRGTYVIGIATGIRDDGLAGAWEIHNDCSVQTIRRTGQGDRITRLPDVRGVERNRGWRYQPTSISEDGQYIYATAINEEGFTHKRGWTIEPGTTVDVRFKLGGPFYGRIFGISSEILCDDLEVRTFAGNFFVIGCNDEGADQPIYGSEVVAFQQGFRKNNRAVVNKRSDPLMALGAPQENDEINFVALGFGGSLTLKLERSVTDGPGADLRVVETSFNDTNRPCEAYPERADVAVSFDGVDFVRVAEAGCKEIEIDLSGSGLSEVQYVRITDVSDPAQFGGNADGYDVDGVMQIVGGNANSRSAGFVAKANQAPDEVSDLAYEGETNMRFYPNPVADVLKLSGLDGAEVRILSLEGKQMLYRKLDQNREVDVSSLPTGMYILDVQRPGEPGRRTKIVKQ